MEYALNPHAVWTVVLTIIVLFLFTRERVPMETTSLIVLVVLPVGFTLFPFVDANGMVLKPSSFFHGFGHEALIAVCALMVAGYSLSRTGALEPIAHGLAKLWVISPVLSMLLTLIVAALLSAFVNNTPIVVLLLPVLTGVALRTNSTPSTILMPMGFATLLGGMSTTIGTSTNLLVVSIAADLGIGTISMFDFFIPGIMAAAVGIAFLWIIAPRMLRNRHPVLESTEPRLFDAELKVLEGGMADGKKLSELIAETSDRIRVRSIYRAGRMPIAPLPDVVIKADDRLVVMDSPSNLKEYEKLLGATLHAGGHKIDDSHPLSASDQHLAELVVGSASPVLHRTLSEVRFIQTYNVVVLAIHRKGKRLTTTQKGIESVRLRLGDVLLVQGSDERMNDVRSSGNFLVLDTATALPLTKYAPRAIAIMAAVIATAALGILPIAISAICGVLLLLLTNCLKWRDIQGALSGQVILIVVASLALGAALTKTGATAYLAHVFVELTNGFPGQVVFSGLMLLMAIITNVVSNNAAAVIGTPIAISIANELGLPAEAFILAVLFGANMSFATPMAYQTNLLVMNAGGYTFMDFVKTGVPLTLLIWATLSLLIPVLYSF